MSLFESEPTATENPFEDLPPDPVSESQARSSLHGKEFDLEAFDFIERIGGRIGERYVRVLGYPMDALIEGRRGLRCASS